MEDESRKFLRVDVRGNSLQLWEQLQTRFFAALNGLLDQVIDFDKGSTLRDEAKELATAAIGHLKARLVKAGLENAEIEARVSKLYAEAEEIHADARKKRAEADAMELATALKRFQLTLRMAKALLVQDDEQSALLISSQIDEMLEAVKALESTGL
jgi:hypothetical protein